MKQYFLFKIHNSLCSVVALCLCAIMFTSCNDYTQDNTPFVINEVMASNQTGLMAEDGCLYDWIELRNVTDEAVSLKGFILAKDSCRKSWNMPDTVVQPGRCVLVFATKAELHSQLHCNFKLSKRDEQIQLYSPRGTLLCEATYKHLHSDQSLRRNNDGSYSHTYHQSPGYENTADGYTRYLKDAEIQRNNPIKLWEYLNNGKTINCGGKVRPCVELKNVSSQAVSLADYVLSCELDDIETVKTKDRSDAQSTKFVALPPVRLAPGEIYTIVDSLKVLDGKTVVLTRGGRFVDGLNCHKVYPGVSVVRQQGRLGFLYTLHPTIGEANITEAYDDITPSPKLLKKPGAYSSKDLYIAVDTKGSKVRFTTDGSQPTMNSPLYTDSIHVSQSTTIRAIAFREGELQSEPIQASYIVDAKHSLPVVCLSVDPDDLFDPVTGIYSKGLHADSVFPHVGANYWHDWERPAHIEMYDSLGGFSYDCGIKIFGGFSRALDKKSFQIKFRQQYGRGKLKYKLFDDGLPQEFQSIVLRSGSQDIINTMVRDEFFTSLLAESSPSLLVQSYRPVVLYINNEYYGVYFIREKINKHFVGRHLGSEPDSTQLLMQQHLALYGSSRDYIRMVNYAIQHDMTDSVHYAQMSRWVDFESLIDFKLGEYYASNTDAGNVRYCRTTDSKADQRWHWIYYDLDASFFTFNTLDFYIRGNSLEAPISSTSAYNVLINRLLTNPDFRKLFLTRWAYHKEHTFNPEHATKVFDNLVRTIKPEMEQNCQRWPADMSYASWLKHVEGFRKSIRTRLPRLHADLLRELHVTDEEVDTYFR